MKTFTFYLLVALLLFSVEHKTMAAGDEPAITVTTTNIIGTEINFIISAEAPGNIYIDWGGGKQLYTVTDYGNQCKGNLQSQTVKIYGDNILSFNGSRQKLTSINVSNCPLLRSLSCDNNELETLDLSNCKAIKYIYCQYNNLTKLNISGCEHITTLNCEYNQLSTIDISSIKRMDKLFIKYNKFTFSTLPESSKAHDFRYNPQDDIEMPSSVHVGQAIDLSALYLEKDGHITRFDLRAQGQLSDLKENEDYKVEKGILTFLKVPPGLVSCHMYHESYPRLTLSLSKFTVTLPTAINNPNKQHTNIYYHNKQVHVKTDNPGQYQVYSLSGVCVQSGTLASGNNSFAINGKGVYIVKTQCKQHTKTQKISVQ